ncbi:ADP-ribosylglycohydrolase family protein [Shimazuella sp. AN120528]|uniref:ADP-ribosylglycohydrolase family protein n=1 Tax=Shimazuella soli TaxID=1892854 RepID=UPI001F101F8B|nr:ADP-ribosylglycohydrolase family protein [Shimazuella soli]MCH5583686.1 ADP-ribosylglycohydrolase family protein [Shimazuella soli]
MEKSQILGGLYGLLVGDAVGVPYEFHAANQLPPMEEIDMTPPAGFNRAHRGVPIGTWSDDGAQALCLLDSLVECGELDLANFADKLWAWYDKGLWAVDHHVFDVGIQTSVSLQAYHQGISPENSGFANPEGKGNGSLMRVLPLALWHQGSDEQLVIDSHKQSLVTHGHLTNQVACALYCLWVREVSKIREIEEAYREAVDRLREIYGANSKERDELDLTIKPDQEPVSRGGGYVVETIQSVRIAVQEADYEQVIKKAISLGEDTDTNAAIAGGLYGVKVGLEGIPDKWYDLLRGKSEVESLIMRWPVSNS